MWPQWPQWPSHVGSACAETGRPGWLGFASELRPDFDPMVRACYKLQYLAANEEHVSAIGIIVLDPNPNLGFNSRPVLNLC